MSVINYKRGVEKALEQHVDKRADRGSGCYINKNPKKNENNNRRNHPPFFVFPDKLR